MGEGTPPPTRPPTPRSRFRWTSAHSRMLTPPRRRMVTPPGAVRSLARLGRCHNLSPRRSLRSTAPRLREDRYVVGHFGGQLLGILRAFVYREGLHLLREAGAETGGAGGIGGRRPVRPKRRGCRDHARKAGIQGKVCMHARSTSEVLLAVLGVRHADDTLVGPTGGGGYVPPKPSPARPRAAHMSQSVPVSSVYRLHPAHLSWEKGG
ncbi:hypothetical protein BC628DRAFT_427237 [Trametes gibbosa]|nr:hypothetical protein BC628DRAFT_427237 [Trametes gibbosa]